MNLTTENYVHSNHFVWIVSHHFTMDKANKDAPLFPQMVISTEKAAPLLPHVPLEWSIHSIHASNNIWGRTSI